ncbi:hypothetical protein FGB62_228g07 [Gracilaria domingensis]|nr:hypothetical protein FGB62_228g07 [Gracilaria domingensis]
MPSKQLRTAANMEEAKSAMERVPLLENSSENAQTSPQAQSSRPLEDDQISSTELSSQTERNDPPTFMDRIMDRIHAMFLYFCHKLGYFFLSFLSFVMLHCGIVCAGVFQLLAFYYTGVLNLYVLTACLLYAPALFAISIIREEIVQNGTSRSGAGPRLTHEVAFAYLILTVFGISSVLQPLFMHADNVISYKSMWISLGGTSMFYYCLLISEVLFASASNVHRARRREEELERERANQPFWIARYESLRGKGDDIPNV